MIYSPIRFFENVEDMQSASACLHNFLAQKKLEDLTAKDLGYLILGPGHICAVC